MAQRLEAPAACDRESDATPLSATEFEARMAALGPFPRTPRIAVALSGGADSLALLLLLRRWTAERRGTAVALIVDHGLRPESAGEAQAVARQARALGLESRILTWRAARPDSGLQAKARAARYRLLQAACRELGLLYLACGHHAEDQAETFLLRVESGSGLAGLAGMSAASTLDQVQLLRPLLGVPKARLRALLRTGGLSWVEDPSNDDRSHRRVALRALSADLAGLGLARHDIGEAAATLGRLRHTLERAALAWLAGACDWRPEGYAALDLGALSALQAPLTGQTLAQVLKTVGGAPYAPAPERVEALLDGLRRGRGSTTLGGCQLLPGRDRLLVVRESKGPKPLPLAAGKTLDWDRRFRVRCGPTLPSGLRLGCLTEAGRRQLQPRPEVRALPLPAVRALPAVWDDSGPLAVPALGWHRGRRERLDLSLRFLPAAKPGSSLFSVACDGAKIMYQDERGPLAGPAGDVSPVLCQAPRRGP